MGNGASTNTASTNPATTKPETTKHGTTKPETTQAFIPPNSTQAFVPPTSTQGGTTLTQGGTTLTQGGTTLTQGPTTTIANILSGIPSTKNQLTNFDLGTLNKALGDSLDLKDDSLYSMDQNMNVLGYDGILNIFKPEIS